MEIQLSTSEMGGLRKLQRNLAGSSDYARVTCVLMLGMGNSPSFAASCLGIDVSTVYRYRSAYLHGGAEELLESMKSKEVKQAIGSPEYKEKIEKGHEIWHYTNNADITIIDEKVQAIKIVK